MEQVIAPGGKKFCHREQSVGHLCCERSRLQTLRYDKKADGDKIERRTQYCNSNMKLSPKRIEFLLNSRCTLAITRLMITLLMIGSISAQAAVPPKVLDDYRDITRNKYGVQRLLIDDKSAGSKSQASQKCENGVLLVKGDLVPGRGVPAFISQVSPLSSDGKPKDLTGFQGVRLLVKVAKGILCVQVGSTEIDNFDYHSSAPIAGKGGEFQEVRIPFKELKRAWSKQTELNLKSITSVNLVSFGLAKDTFAYEVKELGFY